MFLTLNFYQQQCARFRKSQKVLYYYTIQIHNLLIQTQSIRFRMALYYHLKLPHIWQNPSCFPDLKLHHIWQNLLVLQTQNSVYEIVSDVNSRQDIMEDRMASLEDKMTSIQLSLELLPDLLSRWQHLIRQYLCCVNPNPPGPCVYHMIYTMVPVQVCSIAWHTAHIHPNKIISKYDFEKCASYLHNSRGN